MLNKTKRCASLGFIDQQKCNSLLLGSSKDSIGGGRGDQPELQGKASSLCIKKSHFVEARRVNVDLEVGENTF